MNNSFDTVQCEEVFGEEAAFWAARQEADEVTEEGLIAAGEFFDSILPHVEDENLCIAGDICG